MPNVITDPKKIDEILERGVENIYPSKKELRELLLSGKRIRLYCGYDPTAKSLHIGNAISINKLGQFQELGHEIIFLIGDFTGMIGDPTDKTAARKKLTREDALENSRNYQKQVSGYLKFDGDNHAKVLYNSEWCDKLTFKDLIELSSNFTVQQMLIRDMFKRRMEEEKPIYLHEFLYPLAQGYDSVAMDVDLEIGGNDQTFNMLAGRDLMKATKGKEKFVLTTKLLADETGKKMGKTEGNVVNLDETPENMYGQIMAWSDGLIVTGFELCTNLPMAEVFDIKELLKDENNNPRDLKMKLAYEITKINHGEEVAKSAQDHFIKIVQNKEMPDELEVMNLKVKSINIIELLAVTNMVVSKGEARRLINEKAIKVDGEVINDIEKNIEISENGIVLQRGKRQFKKIIAN